ncbi:hypothetical protein CR162_04395 [Pseudoroseomonas rhizosphaerae]|uniref:Calcium-binding protein n=1 Tax=Teichococcus rhizosphaerae TaxID=1335062 RepID=A0A2C7ADF3_9PROT|nr:hypothetical protein [Pseudoroseomonas rhizosphaerae]PHK96089.1 hypothetical protein CR162_04395 [Pseudoroseomonas rhizosphaerae]
MAVIIGTEGNDDLVAPDSRENDTIVGLGGNDRIEARGGNDLLQPGPGIDRVEGGDGRDTVRVGGALEAWEVYRYENEGVLRGPEGVKTLLDIEALEFTGNPGAYEFNDFNEFLSYTYLASNLDVADALGVDPGAAFDHFRDYGAVEGRGFGFDGNSYLAANLDVLASPDFGANADEGGARHYLVAGRAEGRPTDFAGLSYIASHEDLIGVFGANDVAGTEHFVQFGFNEGRTVTFDGLDYVASHDDLIAAFGGAGGAAAIEDAGAAHYIQNGLGEGRDITFGGLQYVASHVDLVEAYRGANGAEGISDAGALHFIQYGSGEGREADLFNETSYAAVNADLAAAGLTSAEDLALHWIQYGLSEGRAGAYDPLVG